MATSCENASIKVKSIRLVRHLPTKSQTTAKDQDMMTLQVRNIAIDLQPMLTKTPTDLAKMKLEVVKQKDTITRKRY